MEVCSVIMIYIISGKKILPKNHYWHLQHIFQENFCLIIRVKKMLYGLLHFRHRKWGLRWTDKYRICFQLTEALSKAGLTLVGPYDILTGKLKALKTRRVSSYVCHWRYYYDPPEFMVCISFISWLQLVSAQRYALRCE